LLLNNNTSIRYENPGFGQGFFMELNQTLLFLQQQKDTL